MKRLLSLSLCLMMTLLSFAYDFEVDGIFYNITSSSVPYTVAVTYQGTSYYQYDNEYTGAVNIPATVTYKGKTYSVTSIGTEAFCECSGLKSVTIPNSVTSIGSDAFLGCESLTKVIVPDIAAWCNISFGNYAANPLYYAGRIFSDENTEITDLVIPNSVTTIGSDAFYGCSGLTSIVVENGNTKYDSRNNCNAIIETASNTLILGCKTTVIPNSVTSIGSSAFFNCYSLTSITIPNSVTAIGSDAFSFCSGLTSVTIGNSVTSIGSWAFAYCSGLTSITIPNSVTSIGSYAFEGCSGLTSVTIGNSVTSIGDGAFYVCSSLKSVTIGNSVTSIGYWAFDGCSGLTKVIVPDIAAWCNISFGNYYANPLYCANIYSDENTEITDLVIPNGVTSIGSMAFYGCSGLKSVTIPNSVTAIGEYAFWYCSGLKKVIVPDIAAWCNISFGNYYANPLFYAKHIFSDENTEITDLVIPNSVTAIGSRAFYGCSGLTSVTIPNSVTSIGDYAFSNCSGLKSVTIPNGVTSIGGSAFEGCSGLKKVIVPDIAAWCNISFGNYYANPLYYAKHIYSDENTEITDLVIPNGVTAIGKSAFYECRSLTSVTIPNSVTSIGSRVFAYCRSLTSITIPNSVKSIGEYAFEYCSSLTSITIPNSVTSIDNGAFRDCSGLTEIYSYIKEPFAIDSYCWYNVDNTISVYVPAGTKEQYQNTAGWDYFSNFIEMEEPTGIEKFTVSTNADSFYSIDGRKLSGKPVQKGIYIVNGRKVAVK